MTVAITESWDDHALERLLSWLEFGDLFACCALSRPWCSLLAQSGLAWRQALAGVAGSSFSVSDLAEGGLLTRWPGIEVFLPFSQPARSFSNLDLVALPLGAHPTETQPIQSWPRLDYRSLSRQTLRWPVSAYTHPNRAEFTSRLLSIRSGSCFPICPLCAGVAFYQGAGFTRADIATGWQSYMLCNLGPASERGPILSTLIANMGIDDSMAPNVVVQLRPTSAEDEASLEESVGDVAPGLKDRADMEMEIIDSFSTLWRGPTSSMAQNIISVALPCSFRLRISGTCLAELGIMAFFCEQVNKTACTSRTRVGRYLDDQPARLPRAHVFGAQVSAKTSEGPQGVPAWLPPDSLKSNESDLSEACPYCQSGGFLLNSAAISVLPWEAEETALAFQPLEADQAFHGSLWVCSSHIWGWRWRRAGLLVTGE